MKQRKGRKNQKMIHNYARKKLKFTDWMTGAERQKSRLMWYRDKYKNANGEIRK